jgi:hypothetical protein
MYQKFLMYQMFLKNQKSLSPLMYQKFLKNQKSLSPLMYQKFQKFLMYHHHHHHLWSIRLVMLKNYL